MKRYSWNFKKFQGVLYNLDFDNKIAQMDMRVQSQFGDLENCIEDVALRCSDIQKKMEWKVPSTIPYDKENLRQPDNANNCPKYGLRSKVSQLDYLMTVTNPLVRVVSHCCLVMVKSWMTVACHGENRYDCKLESRWTTICGS